MESSIIWRILQGDAILGGRFHQHSVLPIGSSANQVNRKGIAHLFFGELHLPQRDSRTMHIEAHISESQVSFAVLWFELEGCFEIRSGGGRLMEVLQHV